MNKFNYSLYGDRYCQNSGVTQLMDDLNEGLLNDDVVMLGGGNPASLPGVKSLVEEIIQQQLDSGEMMKAIANYDGPQGKDSFIDALVDYFQHKLGWKISRKNIALTQGSQNSFFGLFNLFSGVDKQDVQKKVLLPLTPEYIGYSDVAITKEQIVGHPAIIEEIDNFYFKYHIDFKSLPVDETTGLMVVSRPTNPTGNVLSDEEIKQLDQLARSKNVPLLIDNAYGAPFPNILFTPITPFWNSNTIVCMSLSKLGLPGIRTGIVIADEEIISALSNFTANSSLSPVGVGAKIVEQMLRNDQIDTLCQQVIQPYYKSKVEWVADHLKHSIPDSRFSMHQPQGALFVWLRFKNLGVTTLKLYQLLKDEGLLVVPGEYFYPGREGDDTHQHECIRMNIVPEKDELARGIEILKSVLLELWK